jgi:PadR family transcriptional regulator PadR
MYGRHGRGRGRGRGWGRPIRGFLEPCLLLVLQRGKSHGYELKDELGPFGMGNVNPSLVYRALRDMEEDGLVRSEWDTESAAGPARRVYELTREGRERLSEWAEELRHTDRVLHHFLEAVDRTTEEGQS